MVDRRSGFLHLIRQSYPLLASQNRGTLGVINAGDCDAYGGAT